MKPDLAMKIPAMVRTGLGQYAVNPKFEVDTMTLTEAYEALLKVQSQTESIPDPNESCTKESDEDCSMTIENENRTAFQQLLSVCLNVCLT